MKKENQEGGGYTWHKSRSENSLKEFWKEPARGEAGDTGEDSRRGKWL